MKTLNLAALGPLYEAAMMLKSRYDGSSQTLQHPSPAPNHFYRLTDDDRKQLQSALTLAEQPGEAKDHEQRAQEFVTAFEDHESGPIEDAETRIELCRLFVKAQDDATATLSAQLAEYKARACRWYQPDGTFIELTEDEVIEKRKQAAKDLAAMREVLAEVCKAADQTLWPNAISADELALIGMMSASSEKSVDRVREMAETLRTAQTNLKAALARAAALGVKPTLAKNQPCGCVVCTCEDEERCHGCGAKHCGTHPVGEIPNPLGVKP